MMVMVQVSCGGGERCVWMSDEHFLMFLPCEDGSHPGPRAFIAEREKVK